MANLQTLKPSILQMPLHAQLDLHEAIRISRLVPKKMRTKAATKRRKVNASKRRVINSLTPAQAKELLAKMKEEGLID